MQRILLVTVALVASVGLAACAPEPPSSLIRVSHPTQLAGTVWQLVAIQGRPVPVGPDAASLMFGPSEVSGNGSCNGFGGGYTYDPATGAIRFADLVSTKRACVEPARNEVEAAYFASLRGASDASIDEAGRLVISGLGAPLVLAVGPMPAGPALGAPSIAP